MTKLAEELTQSGTTKVHKPVHVKNDFGHVDIDMVRISKKAGEEVIWFNDGKQEATIVFDKDGSPFAQSAYAVPAGQSRSSGSAVVTDRVVPYKYTVKGALGNNDPGVIIDP